MKLIVIFCGFIYHSLRRDQIYSGNGNKTGNKKINEKEGWDHRFNDSEPDLHNIYENIQKYKLLSMLNNTEISEKDKENLVLSNHDSKYAMDLFGGGLLDDWNFSI